MANDQAEGLRRIADGIIPLGAHPRRRVVAVTGGKGGVGKSTASVNLALAWARRGAKILLVDGDLGMADLNLLLGVAPESSLADVLAGAPIEDVLVEAHGVTLVPALNGSYSLANLSASHRDRILSEVARLADRFDTLIVDTAAGIGANVIDLAGAAAEVVVVATPEPLSLADAYACLKVLARRAGVQHAHLLPNSARWPSQADEMVERLGALVERFLDVQLTPLPAIPYDPLISQAAAAGMPCLLHSPDAPASRAFRRAAQRIDALARTDVRPGGLRGWTADRAEGGAR